MSSRSLLGHDHLSAEKKGSTADIPFFGNYGIGITCNARLRVTLDGDVKAWLRRLILINYEKLKPKNRISRFADVLIEQEAEGILSWMVKGAIRHLEECDDMGDYELTNEQKNRTIDFLAEFDSLRHFGVRRIEKSLSGDDLQTEEITTAYSKYCATKDWIPFSTKTVERNLPDLMLKHHHSAVSANIKRKGQRVRGYPNVKLIK
jgi:phage/plasmid-associated DNA primase